MQEAVLNGLGYRFGEGDVFIVLWGRKAGEIKLECELDVRWEWLLFLAGLPGCAAIGIGIQYYRE